MNWFKRRKSTILQDDVLPKHIGIIMDGNGRWAKKRGLPRMAGHVTGARVFRVIAKHCEKRGIEVATFYAFSTENWKRPVEEVDAIMDLLREYLKESLADFKKENIRTRFIGDRSMLAEDIQDLMKEAEEATAKKDGMILNIAINYGGRAEIAVAAKKIAEEVKAGNISPKEVTESLLEQHLYTADQPPVDLILRPSGEYRLSNFLIWQSAYAEYVFNDILWPDFTTNDLDEALAVYAGRHRRFGGV